MSSPMPKSHQIFRLICFGGLINQLARRTLEGKWHIERSRYESHGSNWKGEKNNKRSGWSFSDSCLHLDILEKDRAEIEANCE